MPKRAEKNASPTVNRPSTAPDTTRRRVARPSHMNTGKAVSRKRGKDISG
jgi:hypothetical protein